MDRYNRVVNSVSALLLLKDIVLNTLSSQVALNKSSKWTAAMRSTYSIHHYVLDSVQVSGIIV